MTQQEIGGAMQRFDARLTPARPDLAASWLEGKVPASRFVTGRPMHLAMEYADLRHAPSHDAAVDTQILYGEDVVLYDEDEGWAWVQLAGDSYVGYVARNALADGEAKATHRVIANRSFIYPRPDIKAPILAALPLGGAVRLATTEGRFGELAEGGFVYANHLATLEEKVDDFVTVAESLLHVPYLWGGKTALGLDCSGLVQLALVQAGIAAPRDTDLQQQALGAPLPREMADGALQRGDLIFWRGHVGLLRNATTLLHANAHHMSVASESLVEARARIQANGGGDILAIRRL